jgi:PTS system nitrogen regulatory IIA component
MDISQILAPTSVVQGLLVPNKKKLVQELASLANDQFGVDEGRVFETLWEREKLGSTGVGHGIAIPHGRMTKLDRIMGAFVQLEKPIDFESIDDTPVDLVFLLLTPMDAGADHLKALAKVSRLLRNPGVCEKLRAAKDSTAIYAVLTEPSSGSQAA